MSDHEKSVLEETWSIERAEVVSEATSGTCPGFVEGLHVDAEPARDESDVARLHLIAAAPELYRALAALEWVPRATLDGNELPTCAECGGMRPDVWRLRYAVSAGHASNCALDAALKKARGER